MKPGRLLLPCIMTVIAGMLIAMLPACSSSKKTSNASAADIRHMVDSAKFVFTAERAIPMRGPMKMLTSEYQVKIARDSLYSFLPYFGRSTQAPMDPSKSPLDFTSAGFDYQYSSKGAHEWQVTIRPKDRMEIQQLFFTISDNGHASLIVSSTSRDPITFEGHIINAGQQD